MCKTPAVMHRIRRACADSVRLKSSKRDRGRSETRVDYVNVSGSELLIHSVLLWQQLVIR